MLKHTILAAITAAFLASPSHAADDLLSKPWDDVVAQAKQEGEVVWYNWFLQPRFRELTKGFEDKYGIKVTIPDGTVDGNFSKFLAERDRAEGDIDVMSVPGDRLAQFEPATYFMGPLDPIPGFDKRRTKINGGDGKNYAVAYWGNQTGLAYDPTQLDEAKLPQSFEELNAWIAENPQAFAFNDPRGGGAGSAFIQSAVVNTSTPDDIKGANFQPSWDWFAANSENYGFTSSNADSLTRLNGGEFQLVAAWEDHLAGLQQKGEVDKRMKFYIPKFGMPGGGNAVGIPANAKHKAAALVFLEWLTSAETQDLFAKEMGSSPVNSDAKGVPGGVPAEQRAYATDWLPIETTNAVKAQFIEKVVLSQ
ncbi:ABC transporter substrate-binding protein [Roseibium suaedae]|uniref:Putative spermidine/putrescine transport system substrate-binding protein n=1 Tax=Roseibium suaedae TaxID=735517 RepID=A0A1M7NXW9_9HYPH|nr:extracellular solute-binding protein [Roseibium suaedae]SHN08983.1 putative spermidine/putrescine transport system substrate-binding protein [Roseibium suaedae]